MADNVVVGLPEIKDNIQDLTKDLQLKTVRAATRAAANTIRDQARVNARKVDDTSTKEAVYKNIATAYGRKATQATGNMTMRVGVMGGAGSVRLRKNKETGQKTVNPNDSNPGGDTRYWRFVELGTREVAARPFLRPAMNQAGFAALNAFSTTLERGILRAMKPPRKRKGS